MLPAVRLMTDSDSNFSYWGLSAKEIEYMDDVLDEIPAPLAAMPHHPLIKKSFIHVTPVPLGAAGRFRPPGMVLNVYYASRHIPTAVYESVYYFLRERLGNNFSPKELKKIAFGVELDSQHFHNVLTHPNVTKIMSKTNYSDSHQYYMNNQNMRGVIYPSCRDVNAGKKNFAVMDINCIKPNIIKIDNLTFSFLAPDMCHVKNLTEKINVQIKWSDVS
jgi:hypothetical protein